MKSVEVITKTDASTGIAQHIMLGILMVATTVVGLSLFAMAVISQVTTKQTAQTNPTVAFIAALREYEQNKTPSREQTLITRAQSRNTYLQQLVSTDNATFFNNVLSSDDYSHLPSTVMPYVEQSVQLTGTLVSSIADRTDGTSTTSIRLVVQNEDTYTYSYPVDFLGIDYTPTHEVAIDVSGVLFNGTAYLSADALDDSVTKDTEISMAVTGPQRTLVILADFNDRNFTPSQTPSYFNSLYFGSSNSLNAYYREYSYNKINLEGDVTNIINMQLPTPSCDFVNGVIPLLQNASLADINWFINGSQNYDRVVLVVPYKYGTCEPIAGQSSLGKRSLNTPDGTITASLDIIYTPADSLVHNHEYGHGLGMGHASYLNCGATKQTLPFLEDCAMLEYGNRWDTMGGDYNPSSFTPHFSAPLKHLLGWLDTDEYVTINTPGTYTYTLENYEPTDTTIKAIRIVRETRQNKPEYLWVERRQTIGLDSQIDRYGTAGHISNGVLINFQSCDTGVCLLNSTKSYLLTANPTIDYTPVVNPALHANEQFIDYPNTVYRMAEEIRITATEVTPDTITVTIYVGNKNCSDGTAAGQCNAGHQYCDINTRTLKNDCSQCGYTCSAQAPYCVNGQCEIAASCTDGTPLRQCNDQHEYCTSQGQLSSDSCPICGCGQFYACDPSKNNGEGSCVQDPSTCCAANAGPECKKPTCPWELDIEPIGTPEQ